jgi:hypothetical protein
MRRFIWVVFFFCSAIGSAPALADSVAFTDSPGLAAADTLRNVCTTADPSFTTDDLSGITSPCAVAPGSVLIEMLYFQNASRVGGTALAAYPLVRFETGIARNVEFVLDTPSQVAMSGEHGAGLYPTTHAGYGVNYTFASDARSAASVGMELVPPGSRFVVDPSQSKYLLTATVGYRVAARATLTATATGTSSRTAGLNRIAPAATMKLGYDLTAKTQFSCDFGARVVQRNAVAQSYGDVAVNQQLHKDVTFAVGLGTTFNSVSNAKAHYLASGFTLKLR